MSEESQIPANVASTIITLQGERKTKFKDEKVELPQIAPKYQIDKHTLSHLESYDEIQVKNQLSELRPDSQRREEPPFVGGRISRVTNRLSNK